MTVNLFFVECRARSDCTYVQSDLVLHSPPFYHLYITFRGISNRCNFTFYQMINDKILDWSNLKGFAEDRSNVAKLVIISFFEKVENIVGKGENAGYQYFLLFPQCFSIFFLSHFFTFFFPTTFHGWGAVINRFLHIILILLH